MIVIIVLCLLQQAAPTASLNAMKREMLETAKVMDTEVVSSKIYQLGDPLVWKWLSQEIAFTTVMIPQIKWKREHELILKELPCP